MVSVVIRGIGDIGSAVAHRLFTAGLSVILHAGQQPTDTRRGLAFTDAVFDGRPTLEGMSALRIDPLSPLPVMLMAHAAIPVVVTDLTALLDVVRPEVQRGLAPNGLLVKRNGQPIGSPRAAFL